MPGTFALRVVSPEGDILNEDVEFVVLPSDLGELGILPNHAPLIAGLEIGIIRYTKDSSVKRVANAGGGFVEVIDNTVTVLSDTAERSEDIDMERAKKARERAMKRLEDRKNPALDIRRAEVALLRAVTRIKACEQK